MGFVKVKVGLENVSGPAAHREAELLLDTGALYSMVPARVLREMGVMPRERVVFHLADGSEMERCVGEVGFHCDGRNAVSRVIFGEEEDASVLGVVTMEELGLGVDPIEKKLRSARMILY